jgi:uncharacterized protein YndB with AHSA1/START domain
MEARNPPVAKAGMLIRRPLDDVFEAFVDPAVTARFWFSRGSGRVEAGARLRWEWEMYGFAADVLVKAVEPNRRILIDWSPPTEAEWRFEARAPDRTWVEVENRGFDGSPGEQVEKALDSAGGFALVLAGAKIWLEHGIEPHFVRDRHPHAWVEGWRDR